MKEKMRKIADVISVIFGYGIMLSLFIGGLSFVGYIVALIIGGETATAICTFIYKGIYPPLVYFTSVIVVLGLVKMYLCGETALDTKKGKK